MDRRFFLGHAAVVVCIGILLSTSIHAAPLRGPKGFVQSEGEEIYYETFGKGPALVFSHGYGGNHAIWYQQVPFFAADYRVITWDQRGFGRSSNTSNKSGPQAAVIDLHALLNHLEIDKAHLVGQSMGGWAVTGYALAHPERVLSVVLADTIGGIYTPAIEKSFDEFIRNVIARPPPATPPIGNHPALSEATARRDLAQAFLYDQIGSIARPAPRTIPALLRSTQYPVAMLIKLDLPFLLVVGKADAIFPPDTIRDVSKQLKNARVVQIDAAGHSPYFEQPKAWNSAVAQFLEDHTGK